jgi:hypothetical protein
MPKPTFLHRLVQLVFPGNQQPEAELKNFDDDNLTDAESERQAQIVTLIKAKCTWAATILASANSPATHAEQKNQELERYQKLRTTVFTHLGELTDEYYRAAGAHQIVRLLTAAGENDDARRLLREIQIEPIRTTATEEFAVGSQAALRRFEEILNKT